MLRNTLGKFQNKLKILSGESVLNISPFSSGKIDFSAEFHLVSFVERSALTCFQQAIGPTLLKTSKDPMNLKCMNSKELILVDELPFI